MTINLADNDPRTSITVNAGVTQTTFDVPFEFFALADLLVYVDGTKKTATSDYTIASGGNGSKGVINLTVTGATGNSTVIITRDIALERTTDFQTSGPFAVASLNTELDKLIAIQADLKDSIDRSLRLTDFDADATLSLPDVDTRKGKTLAFNASTGAVEAGPSISDVQTVSGAAADIQTLAHIEDGTDATDAIQSVAGIASHVTSVAAKASLITSDFVADLNTLAVTDVINDINTLATSDIVSDLNTLATSDIVSDLNTLATSDIVSDLNTLATSDIVSDINTLATADIVSDLNTLATSDIVSDLNTLATSDIVTDLNILATSANVTNMATLGASGVVANIATVAGVSSNVTTVADNITGVNSFAERYRVGSSDPSSSLDEGDLAYNTTSNLLKYYNGSSWQSISPGIGSVADDSSPQLGGVLDTNGNNIEFGDSTGAEVERLKFGAGDDVSVYWDGTDGHITTLGTLNIDGADGHEMAKFVDGGAAELYHNDTKRIETTAAGVSVTAGSASAPGYAFTTDTSSGMFLAAADTPAFAAGGTERMRLLSGGGVDLSAGNLKLDNGYGIDFSATSDAGGMTSELLDDYEEGTFTPTWSSGLTSVSYSSQVGRYIKVGRFVHCQILLDASPATKASSQVKIGGLPFTSANVTGSHGGGMCVSTGGGFDLNAGITFEIQNNDSELIWHSQSGADYPGTSLSDQNAPMKFVLSYIAA